MYEDGSTEYGICGRIEGTRRKGCNGQRNETDGNEPVTNLSLFLESFSMAISPFKGPVIASMCRGWFGNGSRVVDW